MCYLPHLNIVNEAAPTSLAPPPETGGWGGRGWKGGDDSGAVSEAGVLSVHVLHAQPGAGLPQLVSSAPGPGEVTLTPEVESLDLVPGPRVSPAHQLRYVSQADGGPGGDRARSDTGEAGVGWGGRGGAGGRVRRRAGVLHAGQSVVAGDGGVLVDHGRVLAAGAGGSGQEAEVVLDTGVLLTQAVTQDLDGGGARHQPRAVGGGHQGVELGGPGGGGGAQPLGPQSQRVHVRELDLLDLLDLEGLQVEVVNVEALVGLHHGVRDADQAVQPGHRGHVGIQLEALSGFFVGSLAAAWPRSGQKCAYLRVLLPRVLEATNTADTALDPNCDGNAVLRFAEKSSLGLVPVSALGQQYLQSWSDSEDADYTTVLQELNC